jgi:hypothetical protein
VLDGGIITDLGYAVVSAGGVASGTSVSGEEDVRSGGTTIGSIVVVGGNCITSSLMRPLARPHSFGGDTVRG